MHRPRKHVDESKSEENRDIKFEISKEVAAATQPEISADKRV